MPSKKKKYNTRFPASRIKKIMQTDEEIGKVAQAVPIIISRTLELFVESLLRQSMQITQSRNAKTLTPSHMKQCILAESRFDFLKDLVKNVPDASVQEDNENNALECAEALDYSIAKEEPKPTVPELPAANYYTEQLPTNSNAISARTPVIQFTPKYTDLAKVASDIMHAEHAMSNKILQHSVEQASSKSYLSTNTSPSHQRLHTVVTPQQPKINFSIDRLVSNSSTSSNKNNTSVINSIPNNHEQQPITPHLHLDFSHLSPAALATGSVTAPSLTNNNAETQQHIGGAVALPTIRMTNHIIAASPSCSSSYTKSNDDSGSDIVGSPSFSFPIPPLAPLPVQPYAVQHPNAGDNLYIDEDYDN